MTIRRDAVCKKEVRSVKNPFARTRDGSHIDINNTDQLKDYVVVGQSLTTNDRIIGVSDRYSNGRPSSIIDYQNHEEIVLYVVKLGEPTDDFSTTIRIEPSTDRRTYFVRNYVGRNAANVGREYGDHRIDEYGHGELRIEYASVDGTYIDFSDLSTLRQYVVISQDLPANTQLTYTFDTYSYGGETSIVEYQSHESITLTVEKLSDEVLDTMPVITPVPTEEPEPELIKLELEYEVDWAGNATITGYSGTGNYLYLSSTIDGHDVTRIGDRAFQNCTTLEKVTIWGSPDIGAYAFAGCTALTKMSFSNDTKVIGAHAFEGCTALSSIVIWEAETIGDYAFAGCTALTDISIPHDTKTIGAHAFEGCVNVTELTIWDVETIEEYAFAGCTGIKKVSIPHDVKYIKAHAFDGCTSLASKTIWDDDTVVDKNAFSNCPLLGTGVSATTKPTATIRVTATPTATPKLTPSATPVPTPEPMPEVTYQKGAKGDEVKHIQELLISLGYLSGKADGDFGNKTVNAVIAFQEANGLPATGIVTAVELRLLESGRAVAKPTPSPTSYSSIYEVALVRKLNGYSAYYLIDTDGKKARFFTTDDTGVQVGKVSGNLDSGLKITYSYGGSTWSETLSYSSGSRNRVTLVDYYGSEWDYTVTDIESAEKILNKPGYHDMK